MENIYDYSSSEDSDTDELPPVPELNIYSQNYSNQFDMSSIFVYIPWNPSLSVLNHLKSICNRTIKHVHTRNPGVGKKYNWNIVGAPSKGLDGRFSVTNNQLLRSHHITLFPNVRGESYKMKQYIENVSGSLSNMPIPASLVQEDSKEAERISNLNRILFQATSTKEGLQNKEKKYVSLNFEPKLSFYTSSTTNSIFIAGKVRLTPDSTIFFKNINQIIVDNIKLLDVTSEQSPIEQDYHISLILGELKGFETNRAEVGKLIRLMKELDFTNELENINISINSLRINEISSSRNSYEVPLNI
ncbi:DEHA2E04158p [Debaryomyces hansenii CBS767]|uniref:DEHA2E04158p n=1 Tax=Debaryomyces hansenii (strain ATCC 36239 / CBS 767 / BCRC 21394 / JCM 1990 / NBRC 0083 / IGC 2968) TaxID=284592 RepID=B5RTU8_DEBHA|nr:DEHA2E04158p [Debaryomyces hansenii CBS767]CAR65760.1 DEHA2E04158p [Debaryomyces hansenii CBS767]|eukprot:XP_002770414.1 DEHA2E04158p [Debaryomyces hansenii CBS767]